MKSLLPLAVYACLALVAAACDSASEPALVSSFDASVDAHVELERSCTNQQERYKDKIDTATRSPDGKGWCCEPGVPTCDCGYFGGFVEGRCECAQIPGSVFGYCDLPPPDWVLHTDDHGCSAYKAQLSRRGCNTRQPGTFDGGV